MSSQEPSPSLEEWRELYEATARFKEIECWNWMWDSDVFGVRDPVSGEVGYCCVMGRLGEHFALAAYLGSEGLAGYLQIQSGYMPDDPVEALTLQKCLMASFEDRDLLQKADLQTIKQLGLKFRGRGAWPLFRSYRPGCYPWHVTRSEAQFLTLALQQAVDVALRFKDDPDLLTPEHDDQYFVRVPEKSKEGYQWRDAWLTPAPPAPPPSRLPVDELRLHRLTKTAQPVGNAWEIDFFFFPEAVKDKGDERPFYPCVILCVDHDSGFIFGTEFVRLEELASGFVATFLTLMENLQAIPSQVMVQREEAFLLLEPVATRLGITLTPAARLKALEPAREMLLRMTT